MIQLGPCGKGWECHLLLFQNWFCWMSVMIFVVRWGCRWSSCREDGSIKREESKEDIWEGHLRVFTGKVKVEVNESWSNRKNGRSIDWSIYSLFCLWLQLNITSTDMALFLNPSSAPQSWNTAVIQHEPHKFSWMSYRSTHDSQAPI